MLAAIIFLGLGLVFATGVGLVLHGKRGRRIDNHRICAKCRYDLHGLPHEDAALCPECGAKLTRPKATRVGNRQPRKGFLWAGVVLIVLGLVGAVGIGIPIAQGYDWLKIQPVWMLVETAGDTNDTTRAAAAQQELLKRYRARELTPNHFDRIIKEALTRQADRSIPWDYFWGDMVEIGRVEGYVSDDQWQQFITEGCRWKLVFKQEVVAGSNLIFRFELDGDRRTATANFVNTSYGSHPQPDPVLFFEGTDRDGNPVGPIAYERELVAGWGTSIIPTDVVRELALPPGEYTVNVSVVWSVYDSVIGVPQGPMGYSESVWTTMRAMPTSRTDQLEYQSSFKVIESTQELSYGVRNESARRRIERDLQDATLQDPLRRSARGLHVRVLKDQYAVPGRTCLALTPYFQPQQLGLCHTIWMRVGETEVQVGRAVSEPKAGVHGFSLSPVVDDTFLELVQAQDSGLYVDIVFRPAPSLMSQQIDTFQFLEEEFVVTDVPLVYDNP